MSRRLPCFIRALIPILPASFWCWRSWVGGGGSDRLARCDGHSWIIRQGVYLGERRPFPVCQNTQRQRDGGTEKRMKIGRAGQPSLSRPHQLSSRRKPR